MTDAGKQPKADAQTTQPRTAAPARRRALWIAATVVVGALVILGFGAFSLRTPSSENVQVPPAAGQADYERGLAALASGDTTKAIGLLEAAAAAGNGAAKTALARARAASGPAGGSGASGAGSGGGTVPTTTPSTSDPAAVDDLGSLLPVSVAGYDLAEPEISRTSAILALEPTFQGPYGKVSIVVMTVMDKETAAAAKAYVDALPKAYPQNGETLPVGADQARFGTDGSRLAAVAYSRGRYVYEVVATASRFDPMVAKPYAVAVATAFPASP